VQAQGPPSSQAQPAMTHSQASQRQTLQQSQGDVAEATGTAPIDANRAGRASAKRAQRTANFFMERLRKETKAKGKIANWCFVGAVSFSSSRGQPDDGCRRLSCLQRVGRGGLWAERRQGLRWWLYRSSRRLAVAVRSVERPAAEHWKGSIRRCGWGESCSRRHCALLRRVLSGSRTRLVTGPRVWSCSRSGGLKCRLLLRLRLRGGRAGSSSLRHPAAARTALAG